MVRFGQAGAMYRQADADQHWQLCWSNSPSHAICICHGDYRGLQSQQRHASNSFQVTGSSLNYIFEAKLQLRNSSSRQQLPDINIKKRQAEMGNQSVKPQQALECWHMRCCKNMAFCHGGNTSCSKFNSFSQPQYSRS